MFCWDIKWYLLVSFDFANNQVLDNIVDFSFFVVLLRRHSTSPSNGNECSSTSGAGRIEYALLSLPAKIDTKLCNCGSHLHGY